MPKLGQMYQQGHEHLLVTGDNELMIANTYRAGERYGVDDWESFLEDCEPFTPEPFTGILSRDDNDWSERLKMGECSFQPFEVTEEVFQHFFELLPLRFVDCVVLLPDGRYQLCSFGFCEGTDFVLVFWKKDDRCFACRTTMMSPGN